MRIMRRSWDLAADLDEIRSEFPVLQQCTYLISNSLGAMPRGVKSGLDRYFTLWAERGVSAWSEEWWDLARTIGNKVAGIIGAGKDEVTMMSHATGAHWIALSTAFKRDDRGRNRIIMTDLDFPSSIYAVTRIADFMGWEVDLVPSNGQPGLSWRKIAERIDKRTLCVAVSHVCFKSAYVQDIGSLARVARDQGAFSLIDGYHAPGTLPVDVKQSGVDFYVGGCLKWLCGGPGNAFLYVDSEYSHAKPPYLTGWLAHAHPFRFLKDMEFATGAYRFMSGTPPVPCLYTAGEGLDIISGIGIAAIRHKSMHQTGMVVKKAEARGFELFTPRDPASRGGAVSIGLPHAFQVKQALEKRNIKVDFRKGERGEPDVVRVAPHFYTQDAEIDILFQVLDEIYTSGEFKTFPKAIDHVT
jgi:kynureninase